MRIINPRRASLAITVSQWAVFIFGAPAIVLSEWFWYYPILHRYVYSPLLTTLAIGAILGGMGVLKRLIDPEVMRNERRILVQAAISLAQVILVHLASALLSFSWYVLALDEGNWENDLLMISSMACASVIGILVLEWGKRRLTQWPAQSVPEG